MYKKNPISLGLVAFIDPANNYSYGSGSVIRDNSLRSNMLVANPTAYLTKLNVTYLPTAELNPFGGSDVYLLQENSLLSSIKYISQNPVTEFDSNAWGVPEFANKMCITHSVYIKQNTSGTLINQVRLVHENVDSNALLYNFATEVITNSDPTKLVDFGREDVGNGWTRLWYTFNRITPSPTTTTFTPGNPRLRIYMGNGSYVGDNTGGFFIYGHQYEYGALTGYTLKTTATRAKWFTARQTNFSSVSALPGPPGQSGELLNGAAVIKFIDPDSQGERRGLTQSGGINGIPSTSNFSAFAWINLDSLADPVSEFGNPSGTLCNIIGRINGRTNNNDFQINKAGTQLSFNSRLIRPAPATDVQHIVFSDFLAIPITDMWVCIGMTWEWDAVLPGNATIKFYVNGVQLGASKSLPLADTYIGLRDTPLSGITLGFDSNVVPPGYNWGQFKGYMGLIGIYGVTLTNSEMNYNYEVTKYRHP